MCVVTTSGVPVNLTTATQISGSTPIKLSNNMDEARARRIDFRSPTASGNVVGNVGRIYVGLQTMNKTTLLGVIFYLDPGDTFTLDNSQQALAYRLGDYFVDADNSGDYLTGDFDPS
jgi:hypothetical protein